MVSVVTTVTNNNYEYDTTVQHPDADSYVVSDTEMLTLLKSDTGAVATYARGQWKSVTIVRDVK